MIERRTARWERSVCVCLLLLLIHFGPAHLRAEGNTDLETANLVIAGAREISEEALRRAMKGQIENLHNQGFRKSGTDDLAYEIERYYRGRGYHFVRVTYRYGEAEATLTIAEGPRVLLGTVAFKGNTVIGDEALAALEQGRQPPEMSWP